MDGEQSASETAERRTAIAILRQLGASTESTESTDLSLYSVPEVS